MRNKIDQILLACKDEPKTIVQLIRVVTISESTLKVLCCSLTKQKRLKVIKVRATNSSRLASYSYTSVEPVKLEVPDYVAPSGLCLIEIAQDKNSYVTFPLVRFD